MFRPILLLLLTLILSIRPAAAQDHWTFYGLPDYNQPIEYSQGRYWTYSTNIFTTSTDGINWKGYCLPFSDITGAAQFGGVTVVAGDITYGEPSLISSTDGLNWTKITLPKAFQYSSLDFLTFGNGLFVAASSNAGALLVSPDGLFWKTVSIAFTDDYYEISSLSFAGGLFFLDLYDLGSFKSSDGQKWTKITLTGRSGYDDIAICLNGNGSWLAITDENTVFRSTDGTTWKKVVSSGLPSEDYFDRGLFAAGKFYLMTEGGDIYASTDGLKWTRTRTILGEDPIFNALIYDGTKFVAFTEGHRRFTSSNTSSWTEDESLFWSSNSLSTLVFGGTGFIGLFDYDVAALNGNGSWKRVAGTLEGDWPRSLLCYDGTRTVAFDEDLGSGIESTNGTDWLALDSSFPEDSYRGYVKSLIFANGLYVAVGEYELIMTSPDAETWTYARNGIEDDFDASTLLTVGYFNGLYIAAGYEGKILTSPDGETWTARTAPYSADITGFASGNGVACLLAGRDVFVSSNGISWRSAPLPLGVDYTSNSITYGLGKFVVTADDGSIFASSNGSTWTTADRLSDYNALNKVVYGNNAFVASTYDSSMTAISAPTAPIIIAPNEIIQRVSTSFSVTLKNKGATATFSAYKTLPPGLKLTGSVLSGAPTFVGKKVVWIKAVNSVGTSYKRIVIESRDLTPPAISFTPVLKSVSTTNAAINIKGWASDNVLPAKLIYKVRFLNTAKVYTVAIPSATVVKKPWKIVLPLPKKGTYTLAVAAQDSSGNVSPPISLKIIRK